MSIEPVVSDSTVPLFSPLTIRGVTLHNRVVVSPMCQYSAVDGFTDDWHLVHLGSRAVGGAGLVMVEATAVLPEGRITPGCTGIWDERHVENLARIARFLHRMGVTSSIQLAHAGRKASCAPPWAGGPRLPETDDNAWTTVAPSAIPFQESDPDPVELDDAGIARIVAAFAAGARRAIDAGFQVIELHNAHGYLLHEFLSPLSNHRTDQYGGSLENRMRLSLAIVDAIRNVIPESTPLFVRISSTDWAEGGWDLAQSINLARTMKSHGVDLIDCSSGGTVPYAKIPAASGFQVPFAEAIRRETGILTGAVGIIFDGEQANAIIASGQADLVFLAREMLREPYWAIKAAQTLGAPSLWPTQYGYAVKRKK